MATYRHPKYRKSFYKKENPAGRTGEDIDMLHEKQANGLASLSDAYKDDIDGA